MTTIKTTTPANVTNILAAAAYVRNETIINGTQAAQLDHMVKIINEYQNTIAEAPRKIAKLEAAGEEKGAAMWRRILERDTKDLAELCAQLRAWLVDFKANRPNVQINLDEPETPNTEDTPATMNANEINENKTMYTDYATAVNWCNNHRVMCNNIAEIDSSVYDNARFAWYDEETEQDTEVYQWFITDCSEWDVEFLEEHFPGLLFTYSDVLGCFVLCVDHFGTAWNGVPIETTLENAAKENI